MNIPPSYYPHYAMDPPHPPPPPHPLIMPHHHNMANGPHGPGRSVQGNGDPTGLVNQMHQMNMNMRQGSWNVNAPEFVPGGPGGPGGPFSQGSSMSQSNHVSNNVNYAQSPEFVPNIPSYQYSQQPEQGMEGYGGFHHQFAPGPAHVSWTDQLLAPYVAGGEQSKVQFLLEIQVGVEQIVQEPEKFQDFAEAIRDRIMSEDSVDQNLLNAVATLIVNMSLSAANVSYPVGKLCAYLAEELSFLPEEGKVQREFKSKLLHICRMEHEARITILHMESERLRRFAVFLAELFSQMKSPQGARLNILGKAMLEQISTLMTPLNNPHETEENLKCVVRILKCCGSALEGMSDEEKYVVNSTIIQLQRLTEQIALSTNTKQAIADLVKLQKNNWAGLPSQRPSSTPNTQNNSRPLRDDYLSPVMFGPDGNPLTDEETAFLQEHLGRQDSSLSTSIPEEELLPEELLLEFEKH